MNILRAVRFTQLVDRQKTLINVHLLSSYRLFLAPFLNNKQPFIHIKFSGDSSALWERAGVRASARTNLHPIPHHLQQLLRMLHRILTVRHAQLLIQIADMRFDGGCRHRQLTGNLLIAVA